MSKATPNESAGMRRRTVRSGMAMTGGSVGVQVLGFVSSIILARLLEPSDIGVMRFAAVVVGTMNLFSGMGMGPAVVSTSADRDRAAGHAFVVTLLSGSLLTLGVFVFARQIAVLMGQPDIVAIIRVLSLRVLFATLFIVPNAVLARQMLFGRTAVAEVTSSLIRIGVAVGMAFAGFGVWSLVAGSLAEIATRTIITFALCPSLDWLRRARWDRTVAGGLWRFGFTQMRTGVVRYIYNNGDDMIVGRVLGARALGFYTQSYSLSNLPVKNISMVVNGVLLPAYSKIRGDKKRLAAAFLSSFRFVSVLTIPLAAGLFILAPDIIVALIGEKWRGSIPILQVFALMSLLRPLSGSTSPLFLALERPEFNLRTALLQLVCMFGLIPVLIGHGATGVAVAVAGAFAAGFAFNVYQACYQAGVPLKPISLLLRTWPVLVATAGMTALVWELKPVFLGWAGGTHNVFSLLGLVGIGALAYALLLTLVGRGVVAEVISTLESARGGTLLPRGGLPGRLRRRLGIDGTAGASGDEPAWRGGCPPALPVPLLEEACRNATGGGVDSTRYQHLSSWKRSGAYRLAVRSGASRVSFIYKEAAYGEGEIVGLEGLPVAPGPPEYALYTDARESLRAILPAVHALEEVQPGEHYRYLFEDLGPGFIKSRDAGHVAGMCARLPGIHAALAETVGGSQRLQKLALRFDADFSARMLPYARENLFALAAAGRMPEQAANLTERWAEVERVYRAAFERVHAGGEVPVHGDLNRANVLYDADNPANVRLIDWEWLGLGVPAFDLAAFLKALDRETIGRALEAYRENSHGVNDEALYHDFTACVLQRGLFDAAFFARQILHETHRGRLELTDHTRAALNRAKAAFEELCTMGG